MFNEKKIITTEKIDIENINFSTFFEKQRAKLEIYLFAIISAYGDL